MRELSQAEAVGAKPRPKRGPDKQKRVKSSPQTDRAFAYIVQEKLAGRELPPKKKLAKLLNLSHMTVEKGIDRYEREIEREKAEPRIDPATFSPSMREKFDMAMRAERKRLEREIEAKVRAEQQRFLDETLRPHYREKDAQYAAVMKARKGVFTKAQFNTIVMCLHPDMVQDPALKDRYRRAFELLQEHRVSLLSEADEPVLSGTLPKTVDELLARKRTKR